MIEDDRSRGRSADREVSEVVVVGASSDGICGVRDYARILSEGIQRAGRTVATAWWERDDGGRRGSQTWPTFRCWQSNIKAVCRGRENGVVIWHYSVFSYSVRGVPAFAPLFAAVLRRVKLPIVVVLHEFAYPWGRRGWRGFVFALTQRAALIVIMLVASGGVVTTEDRRSWLLGRWWLPRRPVAFVPVFSAVPLAPAHRRGGRGIPVVGVFGYATPGVDASLVTQAVVLVDAGFGPPRLRLIGAPGESSEAGREWRAAAARAGLTTLEFTGVLQPDELGEAIGAVDVMVFPDSCGATSRRTTLAACLAAGRAVVAVDGPQTWDEFERAGALVLAPPVAGELAAELERLLVDAELRLEVGRRAAAFYAECLAPEVAARVVTSFAEKATRCPGG